MEHKITIITGFYPFCFDQADVWYLYLYFEVSVNYL